MVIMNRNIPIDIFLPPKEKDINLLVTYDGNGLNTGAFLIRVSSWAVELLSANIGYAYLPGARHWEFAEQGMMSNLIHDVEKFKSKTMEVSIFDSVF
jgi:galactosyl transferase GMA12/MNN10 family